MRSCACCSHPPARRATRHSCGRSTAPCARRAGPPCPGSRLRSAISAVIPSRLQPGPSGCVCGAWKRRLASRWRAAPASTRVPCAPPFTPSSSSGVGRSRPRWRRSCPPLAPRSWSAPTPWCPCPCTHGARCIAASINPTISRATSACRSGASFAGRAMAPRSRGSVVATGGRMSSGHLRGVSCSRWPREARRPTDCDAAPSC